MEQLLKSLHLLRESGDVVVTGSVVGSVDGHQTVVASAVCPRPPQQVDVQLTVRHTCI